MNCYLLEEAIQLTNEVTIYRGNDLNNEKGIPITKLTTILGLADLLESLPRELLPGHPTRYREFTAGLTALRSTVAAWSRGEPLRFDLCGGAA